MPESLLPCDWASLPLERVATLCPVQPVEHPAFKRAGIDVVIKREDLLHPAYGGNKFYKLYPSLRLARKAGYAGVISFGGAYSNHIYALAFAGRAVGLKTAGIIRGERPSTLGATLQDVESAGMELHFVSRKDYRNQSREALAASFGISNEEYYTIPEGGDSLDGSKGCQVWGEVSARMCPWRPTHICVAGGTGGTLAGVFAGSSGAEVHGFLALKGARDEKESWRRKVLERVAAIGSGSVLNPERLHIHDQYHFGGYGKCPAALVDFINDFEASTGIPLDPVYTAKMLCGVIHRAETRQWPSGSRLLLLHSGGLQGRRGVNLGWADAGWSKLMGAGI